MANQSVSKIVYSPKEQSYYNGLYMSNSIYDYGKENIKDVKIRKPNTSGIPNAPPQFNSVKVFTFKLHNENVILRIAIDHLFNKDGKYNTDFMTVMDEEYFKYCFVNAGWMMNSRLGQKSHSCLNHKSCSAFRNEIANLPFGLKLQFQEVFFANVMAEIATSSCLIDVYPPLLNSKMDHAFLRFEETKTLKTELYVSCNRLLLVPGQNFFNIDVNPNIYLEVKLRPKHTNLITIAQIYNGKLVLVSLGSHVLEGDIGVIIDKHIKLLFKEPNSVGLVNVNLTIFGASTYPIRYCTDSNCSLIANFNQYLPCKVGIALAYRNSMTDYFSQKLQEIWERIRKYFELIFPDLPSVPMTFSDLKKILRVIRFSKEFKCDKCQICSPELIITECFHVICNKCYFDESYVDKTFCLIDEDHRILNLDEDCMDKDKKIHIIKDTNIQALAFPQGIFESEFESSLTQFIENNNNSRVFSYLSPSYNDIQKIEASNEQCKTQIQEFQSKAPNQQLSYTVSSDIISYSNPQLASFSNYNMIYDDIDDMRDLTLIATKPTMFDVDIQNQFMKLFHQEGCTFVGCKLIDFKNDDTYKRLYKISQKATYSKFWRDYLNSSDINFICAVRVTNIPAFAKYFDQVRHNTGINWPKNPAHKSSSEKEAEQNLNDFFPELLIKAEQNKAHQKRKLAELPNEKQSLDLYLNEINEVLEDLENDFTVINDNVGPMISGISD
jgi:hypothetical protein